MIATNERLTMLLERNNRRRNSDQLRDRLKNFGVLAKLGDEDDLQRMQSTVTDDPLERVYPTDWPSVLEKLRVHLGRDHNPIMLAPYNKDQFGVVYVNPTALFDALNHNPLALDLDGFWIAGSFGTACVDFDEADLAADIWWTLYPPIQEETKNAQN